MAVFTAIDDAGSFYSTVLYSGTGASNAITGVGFQPDFTWIKNRVATDNHILTNSVVGVTKYISSDVATALTTNVESLKSFDSDGFTVGTMNEVNTNTEDFASWNWKGGTTSGITTDGSTTITPSAYSFNATSGFSVLAYTGTGSNAMLAHGLGVAPEMVIVKNLSDANDWKFYSKYMKATSPEDWHMGLNSTAAAVDEAAVWNDTQPDTVNVSLGTSSHVNDSTKLYIAYCFAPVKGFSKIGGYTGNGNADGTFVYTGFRPAFVWAKVTNYSAAWTLFDNKRLGYNGSNYTFDTNTSRAGQPWYMSDIYSNGFKPLNTDPQINGSYSYVYAAFAENPLVNSSGVPGNAR